MYTAPLESQLYLLQGFIIVDVAWVVLSGQYPNNLQGRIESGLNLFDSLNQAFNTSERLSYLFSPE